MHSGDRPNMSNRYTFSVIGGDRRQVIIIKNLLNSGHSVKVFGINAPLTDISGAELSSSVEKAIEGCDVLLLPLPVSRDNCHINLISPPQTPTINEIIKSCSKNENSCIVGGIIPDEMLNLAHRSFIDVFDFYKCESLQEKNALPSAEGAIMIAMENTDRVIDGMKVLVSGYGRIGKLLANRLKSLGASVSVAARRAESLCEIAMEGFDPIDIGDIDQMSKTFNECDVILNTVPKQIFTKQIIDNSKMSPLYIEIASSPGGIDIPSARIRGIQIIFAPSIPGKYAPSSAGEYIFETVRDILAQRGMNI